MSEQRKRGKSNMDYNLKKMEDETQDQYFYRICSMKDVLHFTWPQMAEIFNAEFGCNNGDTAYRKRWNAFQRVFEANTDKIVGDNTYLKELQDATDELYKAKRQLSDQRREYNKILVRDARADHLTEQLIEAANQLKLNDYSDIFVLKNRECNQEALLCLADWHYGQVSDNIWNQYNTDICKQRVEKLLDKVTAALMEQNVKTLHIALLGDLVNGAIHTSCRVASEENVCDQLMNVSEILAQAINALSVFVDEIKVYSTYGNHARTVQDKNDSIHSDNMEKVIPWWLRQRLKDNHKVEIIDSEYYEFIWMNICDKNVVCTHGDLDKIKNIGTLINTLFSKKYGQTVDYTFSADKHHLESFEQFGIESTLVGSMCGADEYANNKRLYSNPTQTLCMFTPEDGKWCTYNIKL
jgi:hypothetical protein